MNKQDVKILKWVLLVYFIISLFESTLIIYNWHLFSKIFISIAVVIGLLNVENFNTGIKPPKTSAT